MTRAEPHTSGDHAIYKWLFASKEIIAQHLSPIVAIENKLIFEEVDISSLIPGRLSKR